MRLTGTRYDGPNWEASHRVAEAVVTPERIALDWIENGVRYHLLAHTSSARISGSRRIAPAPFKSSSEASGCLRVKRIVTAVGAAWPAARWIAIRVTWLAAGAAANRLDASLKVLEFAEQCIPHGRQAPDNPDHQQGD